MLSSNEKSKINAAILCELRTAKIAACLAQAHINRLRRDKGLNPIFIN